MKEIPQWLYYVVCIAFGAGSASFMIRQSRRDVNGLGRKMNAEIKRSQARWNNFTLALGLICTDEQRKVIAKLLKEEVDEP